MTGAWLLVLWLNYGAIILPMGRYDTEAACVQEAKDVEEELYHYVIKDQEGARFLYEDWTAVCCRPENGGCP